MNFLVKEFQSIELYEEGEKISKRFLYLIKNKIYEKPYCLLEYKYGLKIT